MVEQDPNDFGTDELPLEDAVADFLQLRLTEIDETMPHASQRFELRAAIDVANYSARLVLNPHDEDLKAKLKVAEYELQYYQTHPAPIGIPPSQEELDRGK